MEQYFSLTANQPQLAYKKKKTACRTGPLPLSSLVHSRLQLGKWKPHSHRTIQTVPASTFASCYGTSDESPGKSLERRKDFTFPGLLQDLIGIMVDAPGTLGRQLSELFGSQVIVNSFGSALAVIRWSPAENVVVVIVDNWSGSNGLGGLVRKGGG